MHRVTATAVALLGFTAGSVACAADPPAGGSRIPVAHSAQLQIDAQSSADALVLHARRPSDQQTLSSPDVSVSIDGKSETVTHLPDGSFSVAADDLRGSGDKSVQIIIGHDGIREILDGKLAPLEDKPATSLIMDHKQLAWWILNIGVVLIGVMVLSRKKTF